MTVAFNIITPYLCSCFHNLPSLPLSAYLKPTHFQSSAQMTVYMSNLLGSLQQESLLSTVHHLISTPLWSLPYCRCLSSCLPFSLGNKSFDGWDHILSPGLLLYQRHSGSLVYVTLMNKSPCGFETKSDGLEQMPQGNSKGPGSIPFTHFQIP